MSNRAFTIFQTLTLLSVLLISTIACAQTDANPGVKKTTENKAEKNTESKAESKRIAAGQLQTLETLTNLLEAKKQQQQLIKKLKSNLQIAKESVTKSELEDELKAETLKLTDFEKQIATLTSGITKEAFYATDTKEFNLQEELQSLAEPFVKMVKSTTENARQIDTLNTTITEAKRRQSIAAQAIERIEQLLTNQPKDKTPAAKLIRAHLTTQKKQWAKRLKESINLESTTKQQLTLKEKTTSSINLENYATTFFRTRGVNLIIALFTFFATFTLLRFGDKGISLLFNKTGMKKSFYARLAKLLFEVFTIICAISATMIVLNYLNDWILLGVAGIFTLALAWIGVKVLPAMIEQAILLLNLGAVQEGERLLIDGIPWRVKTLDHYTEFENPALEGGHFTLPIRELRGRHSRPAAHNEAWFPTKQGDWIQLSTGHIAKVEQQTPELIQLIELGGARYTYATGDFINARYRNLSTGFRIRQQFGISYNHLQDATHKLPKLLTDHIKKGLEKFLDPKTINHIEVDLTEAASSSINYDVEVDIKGSEAHRFEDIEGEITRLLIEASTENNLEIPYPQLVIHQENS